MAVQDIYVGLLRKGQACLDEMVADQGVFDAFIKCHSFQGDFGSLSDVVRDRPEAEVLLLAQREYQFALYALSIGNYRHAFISLRLFFELSLAAIHFSANELNLRRWLARLDDIVWARLIDEDAGIYSDWFIRPFNSDMAALGKQYRTLASSVYRECSEHVHGNMNTHGKSNEPLEFDGSVVETWCGMSATIRRCIVFAFAARFLRLMPVESRNALELVMLDVLGELAVVQALY